MKRAYAHAIEAGYRFYSYGDACLLFRARCWPVAPSAWPPQVSGRRFSQTDFHVARRGAAARHGRFSICIRREPPIMGSASGMNIV